MHASLPQTFNTGTVATAVGYSAKYHQTVREYIQLGLERAPLLGAKITANPPTWVNV